MLSHTGTLTQYLTNFVLYTLMTVGVMYGAYWYTRKAVGNRASVSTPTVATPDPLTLESSLALDPHKVLHVVRIGSERFLISVSGEGTQLLSKLEDVPAAAPAVVETAVPTLPTEVKVDLPWYANQPPRMVMTAPPPRSSFGARFVQSVQWLVSSRSR